MKRLSIVSFAIVIGLLLTPLQWITVFSATSTRSDFAGVSANPSVQVSLDFLQGILGLPGSFAEAGPQLMKFDHLGQSYLAMSFDVVDYGSFSIMVKTPTLRGLDDLVCFEMKKAYVHGNYEVLESADSFLSKMCADSRVYAGVFREAQIMLRRAGVEETCSTADDVVFSVSEDNSRCTFTWSKQKNGVSCLRDNYWLSDCIQVSVDPRVGVVFFGNTWDKYEIVANQVLVSKQEAVSLSLGKVECGARFQVANVETELKYLPVETDLTDANPATLYPCWEVGLDYSVTLPNGVRGHSTRIRADTREIVFDAPRGSYGDESSTLAPWFDPDNSQGFDMDQWERQHDEQIAAQVHQAHSDVGYSDMLELNATGNDLRYSSEDDSVFVITHGASDMIAGNQHWVMYGGAPYYEEVWDFEVSFYGGSKSKFVVAWVCHAGEVIGGTYDEGYTGAYGFPFAFTGNSALSSDGYYNPDDSDTVVIAFRSHAPWLTEFVYDQYLAGYNFLEEFYDRVKINSAKDSLDYASMSLWGVSWWNCVLHTDSYFGMVLYGDGNRCLRSHRYLTISSSPGGTTTPETGTHTYDYAYPFDETQEVTAEPYFSCHLENWILDGESAGSSDKITIDMNEDHFLIALFAIHYQVVATEGGITDPEPGEHSAVGGTEVQLDADPYEFYDFVAWESPLGNPVSEDPEYSFTITHPVWFVAVFEFVGIRDINVTSITPDKTIVGQNYPTNVSITVENQGDKAEQFSVTLYANSSQVETKTVTLNADESRILTFTWDATPNFPFGVYQLNATAHLNFDEDDDPGDNTMSYDFVLVSIAGDVDGDHNVNIFDLVKIASAYGTEKGQAEYVANYDIDNNGSIDIFDVMIANTHYGQGWT